MTDKFLHKSERNRHGMFAGRQQFLEPLGNHFLISNERIRGKGEDCGYENYTEKAGIMAVFDGCGGLGSRSCSTMKGKTEAYMASRCAFSALVTWFRENLESGSWAVEELKRGITSTLQFCDERSGDADSRMKGSLVRAFPTTLASVLFLRKGNALISRHIWAGDSRTYFLERDGLAQISVDDVAGGDAMSSLYRDNALKNVISSDGRYLLHVVDYEITKPCIVLAATDGCFDYVPSPMEFEWMILYYLMSASNMEEWIRGLSGALQERAGDDQTLAVSVWGFRSFSQLKRCYRDRMDEVAEIIEEFDEASEERRQALWLQYKPGYYRYRGGDDHDLDQY